MKNYKKITKLLVLLVMILVASVCITSKETQAAKKKTYTIKPSSKPCDKDMLGFRQYNSKTRQYYTVRSYLEKLEKKGGGTLIFKKGTYTITNTLFVPSNVTLIFKDGVVIKKGSSTGTSLMKSASSMFQLIRPSRGFKSKVYGKYKGEKNIHFIGEGKVTIDMKYYNKGIAIIMGHNRNVSVENITFQNMKSGHFIEMDASKKVVIDGCTFKNAKYTSSTSNKEAINLDTPDKATHGFSSAWSKFDKTANSNVTIKNCTFKKLGRALGTHKYSKGKYHTDVKILDNVIDGTGTDAIRMLNWKNCVITGNTIKNVKGGSTAKCIYGSGCENPTVENNTMINAPRAVVFMPHKNSGAGSSYPVVYDKISGANLKAIKNNTVKNVKEPIAKIYKKYKEYTKSTITYDYETKETIRR